MPFVLVKVYICYDSIIQMNNQRHTERIQHIEVYGASLSVLHAHVVLCLWYRVTRWHLGWVTTEIETALLKSFRLG